MITYSRLHKDVVFNAKKVSLISFNLLMFMHHEESACASGSRDGDPDGTG